MKKIELFGGEVLLGISERSDGNMRFFEGDETEIIKNQKKMAEKMSLEKVSRINTQYKNRRNFTEYQEIMKQNMDNYDFEKHEKDIIVSDGLIISEKKMGIILPLADCLGMIVFDAAQKILGVLHAGRHNIEQLGPQKFIEKFENDFGSESKKLKVYFSPCARSNYPLHKFNDQNIQEVAKKQLEEVGILPENILENLDDTTINNNYPSNSCGDTKERFAILAAIIK